jgi:DNA-binding NtrC family response regulator
MRGNRHVRKSEVPPAVSPPATEADRLSLLLESSNPVMVRAAATARQVASFQIPVLLTGETGTGKSALAAAIHGWSQRLAGPFVTISCRGPDKAPREPIDSLRSAAAGSSDEERWPHPVPYGTLFLDEVGMLSSAAQAELIRFLDEGRSVNPGIEQTAAASTRVIAASSRDLEKDVKTGRFRHDLFFRLNVVTIHLPPLRQRREDIPGLTTKLLADVCLRHHRQPLQLAAEVSAVLAKYDWRGNLRELATVIEHATILARTDMIQMTDLPERLLASS